MRNRHIEAHIHLSIKNNTPGHLTQQLNVNNKENNELQPLAKWLEHAPKTVPLCTNIINKQQSFILTPTRLPLSKLFYVQIEYIADIQTTLTKKGGSIQCLNCKICRITVFKQMVNSFCNWL